MGGPHSISEKGGAMRPSKLLKSQALGLSEAENQHGRTFDDTCWVHIHIC